MANAAVETFRGTAPRCLQCNRRLKPQYDTEKEQIFKGTGRKKVWLPEHDSEAAYYPPPADPSKADESEDRSGKIFWSPRARKWFKWKTYEKVSKRKFSGKFGTRRDNFFCKTECGYHWGVAQAKSRFGQQAPT